jgi:hypothetical protein
MPMLEPSSQLELYNDNSALQPENSEQLIRHRAAGVEAAILERGEACIAHITQKN